MAIALLDTSEVRISVQLLRIYKANIVEIFLFIREVKGKTNFVCIVNDEMGLDETCEYGPCMKDDSYDCVYKTRLADYKVEAEECQIMKRWI